MRRDNWLLEQLPTGMVEDDFLARFVTIFQRMGDTVLHQIDTLPAAFDPTVAPDPMVRLMAQWFGVDWVDSSLDDRLQRRIVIEYADLILWRGTRRGLVALLELLTGGPVTVTDSGGVYPEGESPHAPPHICMEVESAGWNKEQDVIDILWTEVPAHATWELWIAGRKAWPAEAGSPEVERSSGALPSEAGAWPPPGAVTLPPLPPGSAAVTDVLPDTRADEIAEGDDA